MSTSKFHPAGLCWFIALILVLGTFAAGYLRFTAAPAAAPVQAESTAGFTLPLTDSPPAPELAPFDPENAEYVLFAFPLQGLYMQTGLNGITLGNAVPDYKAQLIQRGPSPQVVEDILLDVSPNTAGSKDGLLSSKPEFPLVRVRALGAKEMETETAVVVARSAALGCGNCHGREGRDDRNNAGVSAINNSTIDTPYDDRLGLSKATVQNILRAHDRLNRTDLLAESGGVDCASCHDNDPALPNLSTAIHGVHALMDLPDDERACNSCHPADSKGVSLLQRDLHANMGIGCTSCHGTLRDHALALTKAEAAAGKAAAVKRLGQITPSEGWTVESINPRKPGENLPDCLGCHSLSDRPNDFSAFNKWTATRGERFSERLDDTGSLRCPTCHGAPHALYPAMDTAAGDDRDNFQAKRYLKGDGPMGAKKSCGVCHQVEMEFFPHHALPE